ncbi:MAG: hypothetical protein B6U65_02240 [Candidatus Wolframiiraptor sp. EX4484-121]|nr:MAG: hypothetical protein B6U65_02240 [Candidatus Wolframiiraptor sp. EX4484-121]
MGDLFKRLVGRKTIIVGEIGSGKTLLLSRFLDELVRSGLKDKITVIEMAPNMGEVGGTVENYTRNVTFVKYLKPWRIIPPRTMGKDREEVIRYARLNMLALKPLIEEYLRNPTEILLINDLTIYLHAGEVEDVIQLINISKTFTATAYEGERLADDKGSGITDRERRSLDRLKGLVDDVLKLS